MRSRWNKRGIEISTSMLVMLIVGAVIIAASFLTFSKFTNFLGEGSCDIKNVQFLGDLPNKLSLMSGPSGYQSRKTHSFSVPCGDRAFFINLDKIKADPAALKSFDTEPLIKNELDSNTGNNFIIMNGPKMVSATKLEGLSLDYPYNLCFDTKSSRTVNIEMEGRGRDGVNVIPYCEQLECTQVPEILQPNEKKNLIYTICGGTETACKDRCLEDDACYKGCAGVDQACYDTEKQNIENANGNVEVRLRVSTCFPEKTKVEFLVKPHAEGIEAKAVKIFETLPKRCIDNLNDHLDKVEVGNSNKDVVINPDPMLVWSFDTLSKEERVAYHLNKFLNDDCRKELRAVASVNQVTQAGRPITPATPSHPPRFDPANPYEMQRAGFELVQKSYDTVEPAPEDVGVASAEDADPTAGVLTDEVEINLESTEGIEKLDIAREELSLPEGCRAHRNPKRAICKKDVKEIRVGVVDKATKRKRFRNVDIDLRKKEVEGGEAVGTPTLANSIEDTTPLNRLSNERGAGVLENELSHYFDGEGLNFEVVSSTNIKISCRVAENKWLYCSSSERGQKSNIVIRASNDAGSITDNFDIEFS